MLATFLTEGEVAACTSAKTTARNFRQMYGPVQVGKMDWCWEKPLGSWVLAAARKNQASFIVLPMCACLSLLMGWIGKAVPRQMSFQVQLLETRFLSSI